MSTTAKWGSLATSVGEGFVWNDAAVADALLHDGCQRSQHDCSHQGHANRIAELLEGAGKSGSFGRVLSLNRRKDQVQDLRGDETKPGAKKGT